MITVDLVEVELNEKYRRELLRLDGVIAENTRPRRMTTGKIVVDIRDDIASERLTKESFNELVKHFDDLSLKVPSKFPEMFPVCSIIGLDMEKQEREIILFNLQPVLTRWTKPWSFVQYLDAFWSELASRANPKFTQMDDDLTMNLRSAGPHVIHLHGFDKDEPLESIIEDAMKFICEVHEATERELAVTLNRGSLVTFFEFPPTVKVACEQYLQYFIQFLEDLGIQADSEISSNAGKVLFSVTPRDGEEALEAIHKALEAYLALPTDNDLGRQGLLSGDIAHTQLQAQIYHLQGQLMTAQGMLQLSQAIVQAKDETINAQAMQISLFQRHQLIQSGAAEAKLLENDKPVAKQDSEPLFGDMVKVVPIKARGFDINLPEMLRKLKRTMPGSKSS